MGAYPLSYARIHHLRLISLYDPLFHRNRLLINRRESVGKSAVDARQVDTKGIIGDGNGEERGMGRRGEWRGDGCLRDYSI